VILSNPVPADPTDRAALIDLIAEQWLPVLIPDDDQVVELRALDVQDGRARETGQKSTWAGTFLGRERREMAAAAVDVSGHCFGVYWTLHPLRPEFFYRQSPRLMRKYPREVAQDKDVLERRWLLVDVDARRAAGFQKDSATEEELGRAHGLANRVRAYLAGDGWPPPVVVASGNGFHLLYRLADPIPATGSVQEDDPVRRALHALAAEFSGDDGEIDVKVYNPARITKFPGTLACKGKATEERPHRVSRVVEIPAA